VLCNGAADTRGGAGNQRGQTRKRFQDTLHARRLRDAVIIVWYPCAPRLTRVTACDGSDFPLGLVIVVLDFIGSSARAAPH
jgi:hypothetical protein